MAENYAIEGFKVIGQQIGGFCVKNRAHIFTGLGVAGTITTGILSARSGAKAARKIDQKEAEIGRRLTTREKARLCGKDFIAPALAGTLAVVGTVGSDVVNTKIIGERTALLIASEKAYEKLSQKTKEVLGEKKAKQIEDEVVKDKIQESGMVLSPRTFENAPKSGNGVVYPYVDAYSMLPFWSNPDYVSLHVKCLNEMMRELAPRGDEFDYYDKIIGVHYSEWLKGIGYGQKIWNAPANRNFGWNKGFAPDGGEDDAIEYYTTAIEWEPGFAVTAIHWKTDPTDMRLGRLIKSSGIGL